MRMWSLVLGLLAVVALAACTRIEPDITTNDQVPADQRQDVAAEDDDGAEAPEGAVRVVAGDLFFDPEELSAPAGSVIIELVNEGALPHDFVVEEAGNTAVVEVDSGASESGSIDLEAGEYTFYCSVPGHRSQMEGTLVVE